MNCLDLVVPASHYTKLLQDNSFTLILNEGEAPDQRPGLKTLVRMVALQDHDYQSFIQTGSSQYQPIGVSFFDINYIRECLLKSVHSTEWKGHYGPDTLSKYLKSNPEADPDWAVTIYYLKQPAADLRKLNKSYGQAYIRGRQQTDQYGTS